MLGRPRIVCKRTQRSLTQFWSSGEFLLISTGIPSASWKDGRPRAGKIPTEVSICSPSLSCICYWFCLPIAAVTWLSLKSWVTWAHLSPPARYFSLLVIYRLWITCELLNLSYNKWVLDARYDHNDYIIKFSVSIWDEVVLPFVMSFPGRCLFGLLCHCCRCLRVTG